MNILKIILVAAIFAGVSCGKNNGTPRPTKAPSGDSTVSKPSPSPTPREPSPTPSNQDLEAALPVRTDLTDAKNKTWSAAWKWASPPVTGGDVLIENRGILEFFAQDHRTPVTVTDVQVTSWMPDHNHDSGEEKPQAESLGAGKFDVANIYFVMTGKWEMIIRAKLNGVSDELRLSFEIKE